MRWQAYTLTNILPPSLRFLLFYLGRLPGRWGGRNISGDWIDIEEDIRLGIRTFPVRYGKLRSSQIALALLLLTVLSSLSFPFLVTIKHRLVHQTGALAIGGIFLIIPGWRWLRSQRVESALVLFNRACVYPLAMFIVAAMSTLNLD